MFDHYGADHVMATYITGFGAVVARNGRVATPGFAIPNPKSKFAVSASGAAPFLGHISDAAFAEAIGAPPPPANISFLPIDPDGQS